MIDTAFGNLASDARDTAQCAGRYWRTRRTLRRDARRNLHSAYGLTTTDVLLRLASGLLLAAAAGLLLTGCGGGETSDEAGPPTTHLPEPPRDTRVL